MGCLMSVEVDINEAVKRVNEYLSQAETLLTKSYKEGSEEGRGLYRVVREM